MKRKGGRGAGDAWFHVMDARASRPLHLVFSEAIALETSILNDRLHGIQAVSRFFDVFTGLCEALTIDDEAVGASATYLAWNGAAFGGRPFNGVTSLVRGDDGKIDHIRLLCEPFSMLLRFSAAVARRLEDAAPGEPQ